MFLFFEVFVNFHLQENTTNIMILLMSYNFRNNNFFISLKIVEISQVKSYCLTLYM